LYIASFIIAYIAPRISANSNENYRQYNFQASANIFGNLRKISGNIKFPQKCTTLHHDPFSAVQHQEKEHNNIIIMIQH